MKKKILIALSLAFGIVVVTDTWNYGHSYTNGAPSGKSGSPADDATCTDCHSGTASAQTGWITSNVPVGGYVPGTTYTITATVTSSGLSKFGFTVSPQNANGDLMGTLIATNSTETQLTGSGKYITHTNTGVSGTDTKSWSFDWTAPAAAAGTVTFYGAFLGANGNWSTSGDLIYTSSLAVTEDAGTTGINNTDDNFALTTFPNPASDRVNIIYSLQKEEKITVKLYDMLGNLVLSNMAESKAQGQHAEVIETNNLSAGTYFVVLSIGNKQLTKKLLIN